MSNDYSSTHYNFVDRPRQSNFSNTMRKAVVRDDVGRYMVRQCHPKIRYQAPVCQNGKDFNNKTVEDIKQLYMKRMALIHIVRL